MGSNNGFFIAKKMTFSTGRNERESSNEVERESKIIRINVENIIVNLLRFF